MSPPHQPRGQNASSALKTRLSNSGRPSGDHRHLWQLAGQGRGAHSPAQETNTLQSHTPMRHERMAAQRSISWSPHLVDCRFEISEAPTLCHTSEVCSRTQTQQTWRTGHGQAHLRGSTRCNRVNRSWCLYCLQRKGTSHSCLMSVYRSRLGLTAVLFCSGGPGGGVGTPNRHPAKSVCHTSVVSTSHAVDDHAHDWSD